MDVIPLSREQCPLSLAVARNAALDQLQIFWSSH